jgi:hypothetical protein
MGAPVTVSAHPVQIALPAEDGGSSAAAKPVAFVQIGARQSGYDLLHSTSAMPVMTVASTLTRPAPISHRDMKAAGARFHDGEIEAPDFDQGGKPFARQGCGA